MSSSSFWEMGMFIFESLIHWMEDICYMKVSVYVCVCVCVWGGGGQVRKGTNINNHDQGLGWAVWSLESILIVNIKA